MKGWMDEERKKVQNKGGSHGAGAGTEGPRCGPGPGWSAEGAGMGGLSSLAGKSERKQERESKQGYFKMGLSARGGRPAGKAGIWKGLPFHQSNLRPALGEPPVSDPHSPQPIWGLVGQWKDPGGAPKGWNVRG